MSDKTKYTIHAALNAVDNIGIMQIIFRFQDINNYYALEYNDSEIGARSIKLKKFNNGKISILAEYDGLNQKIPSATDKKQPLNFDIHDYNGFIQCNLNDTPLFAVKAATPDKNIFYGLGSRGRKLICHEINRKFFPGFFLTIPIKVLPEYEIVFSQKAERSAFYRDENPEFKITFYNRSEKTLQNSTAEFFMSPTAMKIKKIAIPPLAPEAQYSYNLQLTPALWQSGEYNIICNWINQVQNINSKQIFYVGDRRTSSDFIFLSWSGGISTEYLHFLSQNGFSGAQVSLSASSNVDEVKKNFGKSCDAAIRNGQRLKVNLAILADNAVTDDKLRIRRFDGTYGKLLNPANRELQKIVTEKMKKIGAFLADYPAFIEVLLNSETENFTEPSYWPDDIKRATEALGFSPPSPDNKAMIIDGTAGRALLVPEQIKQKTPTIFPDNNHFYQYLKWFFKSGFGDTELNKLAAQELKKQSTQLKFSHDPFRDIPLHGRNRGLDFYGTWFYCHPDAGETINATETLLNCVRDTDQQIILGPSLWLYQNQIGPSEHIWAGVQPVNQIIPALYLALSIKPHAIELYGVDFLTQESRPENRPEKMLSELKNFSRQILEPYYSLIQTTEIPKRKNALLLSSGSQFFDRQKWGGYGRHTANGFLNLLWKANIPCDIIFEEDITNGKLKNYETLFLYGNDFLPQSIADKINEFSTKNGQVIAESKLGSALKNATIFDCDLSFIEKSSYYQIKKGDGFDAEYVYNQQQKIIHQLKNKFSSRIDRNFFSDSTECYLKRLETPEMQLLFVVNDKRTYGDYAGKKYHAVYDLTLGQNLNISLKNPTSKSHFFYDISSGVTIPAISKNGYDVLPIKFAPEEYAKLIAVYNQKLASMKFTELSRPQRGERLKGKLTLFDADAIPFKASRQLQLKIKNKNNELSMQKYITVKNGVFELDFLIPENFNSSQLTIEFQDLLTQLKQTSTLNLL